MHSMKQSNGLMQFKEHYKYTHPGEDFMLSGGLESNIVSREYLGPLFKQESICQKARRGAF